ncbi:PREDICTED: adhesion G protein-coupled receptor L4-like isoform X1 [Amphimedon queenslandica]|uniref:G-protein coupled receptors family 2 profile 2 domain-containing protein n=3 Tax=Amphimedon queenslandica TaxID=400682 RepID=A0AAN0K5D2_AMPQE|nr:PREDICTED: adhesion G protein-coupled receptor L4-like isoform X1 [Amphimedon queenslandica]|eukprot:XP_019864485.1 PREDICTED: adhesion G protein-coupled receptor L4-like isoform X1 [Amphimedon queenslandica]
MVIISNPTHLNTIDKQMATSFLLLVSALVPLLTLQALADRIDAFQRCLADTDLPSINTSKPTCSDHLLEIVAEYDSKSPCGQLKRFAAYIELHDVPYEELSSLTLSPAGDGDGGDEDSQSTLKEIAYHCYYDIDDRLCSDYNFCIDSSSLPVLYTRDACLMESSVLIAGESFNEKIYTYQMAVAVIIESNYADKYNPAITQHYMHTCMEHYNDIEICLFEIFHHCFTLEDVYYYTPYWCYYDVLTMMCSQFKGDEQLLCEVVLEARWELSLVSECTNENNKGKCEDIITGIVDTKPISQINSSDIDQMKAVLSANSRQLNYTNETLTQLSRIVEYFSLNQSAVSMIIDKQDANTFLSVISGLASENGTRSLMESSSNNSGSMLLHNLEEMSKLIGVAVINGNDIIDGRYSYNDNNIGVFLSLASSTSNYTSGELKLNKTDTNSSNMTASILIPPASICNSDTVDDYGLEEEEEYDGSGEDYYYYYYDELCPKGVLNCTQDINGYEYVYYNLYELFGDCSRKLKVPRSCPVVITTSIADSVSSLLSASLPENMTIASLVLSSQIVTRSENNSTNVTQSLRENAMLQFKLLMPMNLTEFVPKCYYWDTLENVWSDDGIETLVLSDQDVLCNTSHLTSFAVLVDHQGLIESTNIPSAERKALSIVGYIGPGFSLLCLIIALVIMIALRKRMNTSFLYWIHLNLCISLLLALTVLLVGLETAHHYNWLCSIVAGLLHYLFLCVFAWMLAEGITLFIMVVYVFGIKFLKWQIFIPTAWGIPLFIVAISAGIRHDLYGTDNYCWLSSQKGLVWAFLGPALTVAVVNTIFLVITMIQIVRVTWNKLDNNKMSKSKNLQTAKSAIFGAIVLFPLLGITWIIGVFAVSQNTTVFLWLFTICNSLQGVFILIFHVFKHRAFLTLIARKCPCMDRFINVHSSVEASRKRSTFRYDNSRKKSSKSGVNLLSLSDNQSSYDTEHVKELDANEAAKLQNFKIVFDEKLSADGEHCCIEAVFCGQSISKETKLEGSEDFEGRQTTS